jgi:plasmid maintenance system antidote protein VapI
MYIHIGEVIKNLVKNKGISVTDFADKINYSRRNVYEIFDKKTIDTGLLIKIGSVLGKNLFLLYVSDKEIAEHKAEKKSTTDELVETVAQLKSIVASLEKIDSVKFKKGVPEKKKSVKKK